MSSDAHCGFLPADDFADGTVGASEFLSASFLVGRSVPAPLRLQVERLRADLATHGGVLLVNDELRGRDELPAAQALIDGRHRSPEARRAWTKVLAGRCVGPQLRALLVGALLEGAEQAPELVAGSKARVVRRG